MDGLVRSRVIHVDFGSRKVVAESIEERDKWELIAAGLYKYTRVCTKGYAFLKTDFYGCCVYERAS